MSQSYFGGVQATAPEGRSLSEGSAAIIHLSMLALALALSCMSCSKQQALRRVAHAEAADSPPAIEQLIDLGALPQGSSLSTQQRDDVFTPGEWMAIVGPGLARKDAQVHMGGRPLAIASYLERGLLVRVPRGLSPRAAQVVRVQTALGKSERAVTYRSHVVVSDVSGNRLRFLPMSPLAERLFEKPHDLELTRVRKHVFSPDGGLVHAVQAHAQNDDGRYSLSTVHVGAREHPALLGSIALALTGVPRDLLAAPQRSELWLLTSRELVVLNVRDPRLPRESARVTLPEGTPWSLAALAGDTRAAVLEREQNVIWLFDMSVQPRSLPTFQVPPSGVARASIALLSQPAQPTRLWVLQGKSLARLATRSGELGAALRSGIERAKDAVGIASTQRPDVPAASPEPSAEEQSAPPARVLGLELGDSLSLQLELPLPEATLPLFMRMGTDGRLLVSAISSDAATLFGTRGVELKALMSWLAGSTQLGRVLAVDPLARKSVETLVQGSALFFELDQLPDGQLVYSALRPTVHVLPPGPAVDWNIEAPQLDKIRIRTLGWTFILPPYVSPPVSIQ